MDLNSSEPTFQPGVEESGSIPNIGRILDKNINESLRLWPVSLCSYPTQLCTVRDYAHSYVNIRHSRFHILPPPIELFSGGSTPWYIHPQEDRPREEDCTGSGNQFGVIWEGNLRVPAWSGPKHGPEEGPQPLYGHISLDSWNPHHTG